MSRLLYSLLWLVLLPLALLRLYWRGLREPGYRRHLGERLAHHPSAGRLRGAWWVHAVSVGETRAAQPLVEALLARDPEARVLLTQMTPTGRRTAAEVFARHGERVRIAYLPYDLPWLAGRFLDEYAPRAGILMETEIWPNLLFEARRRKIPMLLANARLSDRSARSYARLGGFARQVFAQLGAVAAQSNDDAGRLAALGAPPPEVTGSVKFDVLPPADLAARSAELARLVGTRTVLLAASTRDGEEEPILRAYRECRREQDLLLLVPRHPQRFDEIGRLLQQLGIPMQRRSAGAPVEAATLVLLGDSMGEMFAYLSIARVALIGGSFQPLGGQNLLEACALGIPVVVGPHTFNFAEATRLAIDAGAARRVADAREGIESALEIATRPAVHDAMAAAGLRFCESHRGATQRTLAVLDRLAGRPES